MKLGLKLLLSTPSTRMALVLGKMAYKKIRRPAKYAEINIEQEV
jgi:hypothetical protein